MKLKMIMGIVLTLLLLISALLTSLLPVCTVYAHDPGNYVAEPSGHYSTLCTNDNKAIEDKDFAKYINDSIVPKGFNSMIFVFGECFGGGMIRHVTDLSMGASVIVGISASMYNEGSWGSIASDGEDYFLQEFAKALDAYDGSNASTAPTMSGAYDTAKKNDKCAPNGTDHSSSPEHPQIFSGGWLPWYPYLGKVSGASAWKAILWVGQAPYSRYWNDINRIHKVLTTKYGFDDVRDIYVLFGDGTSNPWISGNTLKDGGKIDSSATKANMENAIKNWLAPKMNTSVQFFFWSSDHGGNGTRLMDRGVSGNSYPFQLSSSFIHLMMIEPNNIPYISLYTYNVVFPNNKVYLNGHLLGNLTITGPGGTGNDTFYFDDNVVPLYSDRDNIITFGQTQPDPYEVSNVSICTGGISTMTTPLRVGGVWIPVDKLELLAPYIGLTILLAVAATTVAYVKKRKRD